MRELERRFPGSLAVVGVHSGKFTAERVTASIRDASIRLGALHPIVNDRQFRVWRSYAVNAWPTLVAVDPRGYVVGTRAGEFTADSITPFIERVLAGARAAGTLAETSVPHHVEEGTHAGAALKFPGKVAIDGQRIAIADSGNHRIVVGTLDDPFTLRSPRVIGDGPGHADGTRPSFDNPQGVAFDGDVLYVADAGNHAIRAVDLLTGSARTLAGIGRQARTRADLEAGALSSPWDVALLGDTLFVAMAGMHQLWTVDVRTGVAAAHSGSGAEELHDGPHGEAALAQPMGLCVAGGAVAFCDSESSAVRLADVARAGGVRTVVGTGLFDFGDVDGTGDDVRVQHPQGIACAGYGRLLVVDSYNGALKWVDVAARRATTWVRGLDEPSGLAMTSEHVYVAEVNRHRILVIDRKTADMRPLEITPPG